MSNVLATFIPIELDYGDGKRVEAMQPNPVKKHVRDYAIASNAVTVTLAANGRGVVNFEVDSQGHFEWRSIVGQSTGAFSVEFYDTGRDVMLQNRAIHSATVMGNARRPFRLPAPYFIYVGKGRRVIQATFVDLSGSPNTVRMNLRGRRWFHNEAPPDVQEKMNKEIQRFEMYDYFLTTREAFVLDGAGAGTGVFEAGAEADTEIMKMMVSSASAFTFKLREEGSIRALMSDFIDSRNGMGTAQFPYVFTDTYFLERNRFLNLEVTGGGAADTLFVTLAGRRLRYF